VRNPTTFGNLAEFQAQLACCEVKTVTQKLGGKLLQTLAYSFPFTG
jgi:hypothetical protein